MTHSKYLSIIGLAGAFSWVAFFLTLFKLSPYESMGLSMTFFFVTLFIALSCTFTVVGFYFRMWLFRNEVFYRHISISMRQGIFLSLIVVFCFVFLALRVLNWWTGMLLILAAVLLEAYFSSKDSEALG